MGAEAAGSPPEEGGPSDGALAKAHRGEYPAGVRAEGDSEAFPRPSLETPSLQVGVATRCTSPGPSPSPTPRVALAQVKDLPAGRGAELTLSWCWRVCHWGPGEHRPTGSPLAPGSGCPMPVSCSGDLKKFERMSSGAMSSSEELADQEGSVDTSAFEQGEAAPGLRGAVQRVGLGCGPGPDLVRDADHLSAPQLTSMAQPPSSRWRYPAGPSATRGYPRPPARTGSASCAPRPSAGNATATSTSRAPSVRRCGAGHGPVQAGARRAREPLFPRVFRGCPEGRSWGPRRLGAAGAARSLPPHLRLRPVVLPGLPQEVSGDLGHPVRPQEASGPPAALWPGLQPGSPWHPRWRSLHPQEVHL